MLLELWITNSTNIEGNNGILLYHIIPNRGAVRQSNGLEIHNLETGLILPVFKSKLYHY